ncbi:hypothetical protein HMPREF1076_04093 [Parabacteroides goldsteinii CL02T12C30]|uniref:Uncharacterized protein n=1 Tax=Parabacteroides goldsteinii CL02T12C30 TaxID=999418 RepID=K5ZEM9_9BACT|nr:hypothetical protein [Parabacteroides goldsteinii]EKN09846.1 hypothetical protein HMPREF1076_04093 [Parabacteroides goldsteinii CL02T12C30]
MEQSNLYQITVNRDQLLLIANCLEDICRFAAGQPELYNTILHLLARHDDSGKKKNEIEAHLYKIKKIIYPNLDTDDSYGYDGGNQTDSIRKNLIGNTYQIYYEILHFLALDEKWNNVFSGPTLPSGSFGTVKVDKI